MSVSRSWCYTLNNYTDQDISQFDAFLCTRHRCALEVGESGTKHMQGMITFTKAYKLSGLKKLSPNCHWEICKCFDMALNYCTKGKIIIEKDNRQRGRRNDIHKVTEEIVKGEKVSTLALEYPVEYVKYYRGFEKLQFIVDKKNAKFEKCQVTVIHGPTRTGKTTKAYEIDPGLYDLPVGGGNLWFDGYDGEKTILLDDFEGQFQYYDMLRVCDGHPGKFPFKGGFYIKNWNHVIITSNKAPSEWWMLDDVSAFIKGRITCIMHVT